MLDIEEARRRVQDAIKRRRDAGQKAKAIADDLGIHPVTLWEWQKGEIGEGAIAAVRLVASECGASDQPKAA